MKVLLVFILILPALAVGASVVSSFSAPANDICGMGWDGTSLWAVDGATQYAYQLDPSSGAVLSSFEVVDQPSSYNPVPGGVTYRNDILYISMYYSTSYGKVYKYNASGTYLGNFDVYC